MDIIQKDLRKAKQEKNIDKFLGILEAIEIPRKIGEAIALFEKENIYNDNFELEIKNHEEFTGMFTDEQRAKFKYLKSTEYERKYLMDKAERIGYENLTDQERFDLRACDY